MTVPRRTPVLVLVLALAAACGADTAAGTAPQPAAPSFVLSPADFTSARVATQSEISEGAHPGYVRMFKAGSTLGTRPLYSVSSRVVLYPTATAAGAAVGKALAPYRTKRSRVRIAKGIAAAIGVTQAAKALGGGGRATAVHAVVGAPVPFGAGVWRIPATLRWGSTTLRTDTAILHVDRALEEVGIVALVGQKIDLRDLARAVAAVRQHATTAFTVVPAAAPSISGTAARGLTLTAHAGDWSGAPSDFAYAWSRCDPAGAACTPVPGATAPTYTAAAADRSSTLRVTVTASNTVSSQQATSPPTTVVS